MTVRPDFEIPRIRLPFPARLNPLGAALAGQLAQSAAMAGVQLPRAARYERLVARMYPSAPWPALTVVAEAVVWLFLLDDHLDQLDGGDPGEVVRAAVRVLDGGELPDEPVLRWLWRWRGQAARRGPISWWPRCAGSLRMFAASLHREAVARQSGRRPSVDEYLRARLHTSGWLVLLDLVEFAEGTVLPRRVREREQYVRALAAAGEAACAVNDLRSWRKEASAGEAHNLVLILSRQDGRSLAEAIDHTAGWVAERLRDYLRWRRELLAAADPADRDVVGRHLAGVESLMRGSLDWSLETGRYRSPEPAESHGAGS